MPDRELAETDAGWFRALADATRVQVLNLLAQAARIVARVPVGQSTVSAHLKSPRPGSCWSSDSARPARPLRWECR
jgi:DNA-binding transcriptional ArsR family regulator